MNPLAADLDHILAHTQEAWEELRDQRVFITGGTGFFGRWLLESFAWANQHLQLGAEAVVLTRHPDSFAAKMPHLASRRDLHFLAGDVRDFSFPPGAFAFVIHAGTTSTAPVEPLEMFGTIVDGTRRVLEFAATHETRKLLFVSSGAVYGSQPPDLPRIPEDYAGAPDPLDPASAYAEGKRAAELLCGLAGQKDGTETKIARCFAFVGPHLPLDAHFAIGNFIRDGLCGGPVHVRGDGTPFRSYLYAADLAIWLWTILFLGKSGRPYNVGSEEALTIRQVADAVAAAFEPARTVTIDKKPMPGAPAQRYIPSTNRAREELGLETRITLPKAINRTVAWHEQTNTESLKLQELKA
ncbi:MAG: NAD(P)-dependent oxidoreductase [Verrucomicrobiota bacterium]|jgi:dTDP-glucose 4,6-dehydratase